MEDNHYTEIENGVSDLGKSRSAKKRESTALQNAGEKLAELGKGEIEQFALPHELHHAILDWKGMKKHEARRRQMQYIGRLMRELDEEEQDAILARMQDLEVARRADAGAFKQIESLRAQLLSEESAECIARLKSEYPALDEKKLKALVSGAKAGTSPTPNGAAKKPRQYKEIFHFLNELLQG